MRRRSRSPRQLVRAGATVVAHDPIVRELPDDPEVAVVAHAVEAAWRADAVVLMTDWYEYRHTEYAAMLQVMRGAVFVDGRNLLDPARMISLGFDYVDFGRTPELPASAPEAARASR